jgi:hypothetical protein
MCWEDCWGTSGQALCSQLPHRGWAWPAWQSLRVGPTLRWWEVTSRTRDGGLVPLDYFLLFPPLLSQTHTHRYTHPHPTGCVAAGAWWWRLSADGCLLGSRARWGHQGEKAERRASTARLCRVSLGSSCLLHACLPAMNTAIAACRKTDSLSPNTRGEERGGGD